MIVKLMRIGNSRSIRIPESSIEQCGLGDSVNLRVEKNHLFITADRPRRQGWAEAIEASGGTAAKDQLLLGTLPQNEFDRDEWQR